MKKFLIAATAALCIAGSSFAQENAGGSTASNSASGEMKKEKIIGGAVGFGILAAMVANNRGSVSPTPDNGGCEAGEVLVDGVCVPETVICEAGEELVDGECVPVNTTNTVTTTVTATNTVTSTMTTPVTVTATTTL